MLDPVKTELKESADVYFEYELEKSKGSRSFDLIRFKVIGKKNAGILSKKEQEEYRKEVYERLFRYLRGVYGSKALGITEAVE